jgi:hypothetical protein
MLKRNRYEFRFSGRSLAPEAKTPIFLNRGKGLRRDATYEARGQKSG